MNDQAQAAVENLADGIIGMLDKTPDTEGATLADVPKEEVKEQPKEVAEAPKEAPKEETPVSEKKKIKWQGQEVEIEPEKEIELIQKGYDYTQKTQELSRKLNEIAPLEGLAKQLEKDPNLAKHIASYFQQEKPEKEPTFDDPVEEFKYKTKQEILKEVQEKFVAPLQEQAKIYNHQQALNQVKATVAADPLYNEVQAVMVDYVKSLPPALRQVTYLQLDQDPKAYMEAYGHFRKQVETKKSAPTELPEAKKTERAPILESAGKAPEVMGNAKQAEKVSKLKRKALEEGDPKALADWLNQSGAIDHLV